MLFLGPFFFFIPLLIFVLVGRAFLLFLRSAFRGWIDPSSRDPRGIVRSQPGMGPLVEQPGVAAQTGIPAQLESRVFALAYKLGGRITVSDVIIETGLGTKAAEALLDGLTDEVRVRMIVEDRGFVVYEFPEIADRVRREREQRGEESREQ